ncbi:SDR family oxidoreductase [Mycobacterium sp. 236(2023)]|uniref:SDR family NAD(P)-dependent oxidoreductase n=1 Tax=Mycobacterium sp. 236(2023) TaxID=3038163 RepID=UPI002414F6F7|nr:SDR family oxidoreductase [Mycobacterium sp. 236(2023)]MDG4667467.1 SDR family oxidoreductase [Mycobacterium sp. 236(2023)]
MNPSDTLAGRTALVTGSTSGLGAGIAAALAEAGAHVIVTGRTRVRGEHVVQQIESRGGRAEFIPVDLAAGAGAIAELVASATDAAGGAIDILVNNAATLLQPEPTSRLTENQLASVLAVNVTAPILMTGLVGPAMARRGTGSIVNIGSTSGLRGSSGSALYGMTKAAMHSLTMSWADEYGPSGVRVNAVAPGPIATERNEEFADGIAPILARIPAHRMSSVQEVAAAVVFLAGPGASNVHGVVLPVDGGFAAV